MQLCRELIQETNKYRHSLILPQNPNRRFETAYRKTKGKILVELNRLLILLVDLLLTLGRLLAFGGTL